MQNPALELVLRLSTFFSRLAYFSADRPRIPQRPRVRRLLHPEQETGLVGPGGAALVVVVAVVVPEGLDAVAHSEFLTKTIFPLGFLVPLPREGEVGVGAVVVVAVVQG